MSDDPIDWSHRRKLPQKAQKAKKSRGNLPDRTGSTKVDPSIVAQMIFECRGLLSPAARKLGISRSTVIRYVDRFPVCRQARDDAREAFLDSAENQLANAVEIGDMRAIMFALKFLGKDRGYIERQEITGADGTPLAPSWFVEIEDEEGEVERLDALPVDETN